MQLLFKHGIKLTFANFLGFLLNMLLSFMLNAGFYVLIVAVMLGTVGGIGLVTDFSFDDDVMSTIAGSIIIVPVIIIFILYLLFSMLIQSMLIGGLYGSTIESVFENRSSIGTYFSYSFQNLWRLTGLQIVIFLFGIPFILLIIGGNFFITELISDENAILPISFTLSVTMLFLTLFLHAPIFVIRQRAKIWKAISLTFRLLIKKPLRVLWSGVIFFGTMFLISGVFILIFGIPAVLGYLLLGTFMSQETLEILGVIYFIMMMMIWMFIILPYSIVSALLMLLNHYRNHFHYIIDPKSDWVFNNTDQAEPIFTFKNEN